MNATSHPKWRTTTHDWSVTVDHDHLRDVRTRAAELAPSGLLHLVLEVLAYAAEEAEARGAGHAVVVLRDGEVSVADDGRGTDTRADDAGRFVGKPVMATRDVRFFAASAPPLLPDGAPRRGMSVVAALSDELVHTNRRANGSWTQRYAAGVPVTDLEAVPDDGTTGTTVSFSVDPRAGIPTSLDVAQVRALVLGFGAQLTVDVVDERRAS